MGPRTQIVLTVRNLFLMILVSSEIVLDNVLMIWIELIKPRNDNAMGKVYRFWTF